MFLELARYSNANFLSDDTIFSGFTYPKIEDTELWTDTTNNRDYLRKLAVSNGVQVEHLAASSFWYFYRLRYFPQDKKFIPVGIDDKVHADYASLLLPRAAGYSANLLSYFFRGEIDMKEDKKTPGTYKITNKSMEDMSGTFSLYYDDKYDNRKQVPEANLSAVNGITLPPGGASPSIPSFSEPTDIKKKGKYMLVFNGALGQEQVAVVGKEVTLAPGIWEDWEGHGGTSKQQWTATGLSNDLTYVVVNGYGSNASNVLKMSGGEDSYRTGIFDYIVVTFETPVPMPKTISFDYFAKTLGLASYDFDMIELRLYGTSGGKGYTEDLAIVNTYWQSPGCGQMNFWYWTWHWCKKAVSAGSWQHVETPVTQTGELKQVYLFVSGKGKAPYEIYIDNIDLKWE